MLFSSTNQQELRVNKHGQTWLQISAHLVLFGLLSGGFCFLCGFQQRSLTFVVARTTQLVLAVIVNWWHMSVVCFKIKHLLDLILLVSESEWFHFWNYLDLGRVFCCCCLPSAAALNLELTTRGTGGRGLQIEERQYLRPANANLLCCLANLFGSSHAPKYFLSFFHLWIERLARPHWNFI